MIRYISLGFLLVITMLAIISRKNYSKYKDVKDPLLLASYLLIKITPVEVKEYIRRLIRRVTIVNVSKLSDVTNAFIAKLYHDALLAMLIISAIAFMLSFIPEKEVNEYKIERPEVGGNSEFIDLELHDEESDENSRIQVEVFPREYTEEEFEEYSEAAKKYIDSVILGENISKDKVTKKLILPTRDETGNLRIQWESSDPLLVGSDGEILYENIEKSEEVTLDAEILDETHKSDYQYKVVVQKEENLSNSDRARDRVISLEEDNRSDEEMYLPEKVGNVSIRRLVKTRADTILSVFVIGIIFVCILSYYRVYKLKEKGEKRDNGLYEAYFSFVNRLTIHIGAGLTIQEAFRASIRHEENTYLSGEIEYALNRVASGVSERVAYIDLGNSIGMQEYIRLMSFIVQNLAYGNSNLITLLNDEIKNSFYLKREQIRKKGEKASEKLLLPTSILLILVIIVVMYPAFVQM